MALTFQRDDFIHLAFAITILFSFGRETLTKEVIDQELQSGTSWQRSPLEEKSNPLMQDMGTEKKESSSEIKNAPRGTRDLTANGFGEIPSRVNRRRKYERLEKRPSSSFLNRNRQNLRGKPNIIFLLMDDQDIELGSMNFMPRTLKFLGEEGAHFPNAYVTTPMCCPSRSSILTGLYTHNHNVHTNNDNCSSLEWQKEHETKTFATYLNHIGYRTAFFGKYLNEYNGSYIPPGWKEWSALIRNSRFYNYTLNVNGKKVKHGDDYSLDYFPDLIINDSLSYLRHSKDYFPETPLMMVLSFPTPHGPEDAAPQYQHLFHNVTTHRTPSWDFAPNPDKQWLLRHTKSMEQIHIDFTDMLHTKRLQTLQSVDVAVERLHRTLKEMGELENTYIVYTSDHGYHLGQFGLVKGKSMPFEFDVRVPFYVRGPKVPHGIRINEIVLNIDLAPTFLDMAGIPVPKHIDGQSFLPLLRKAYASSNNFNDESVDTHLRRDSFLIERKKTFGQFDKPPVTDSTEVNSNDRINDLCLKPDYQSPCTVYQKWYCVLEEGQYKIRRCKRRNWDRNFRDCICPTSSPENVDNFKEGDFKHSDTDYYDDEAKADRYLNTFERRLQRRFLKEHVNRHFRPSFIKPRSRRESTSLDEFDIKGVYELNRILNLSLQSKLDENGKHSREPRSKKRCSVFANKTISCPEEVYSNKDVWKRKKERVEHLIKKLRLKLEELKGIRKHLKGRRPGNEEVKCDCRKQKTLRYGNGLWMSRHLRRKHFQLLEKRLRKKEKKMRRKMKFENTTCNFEKMNCFTQDNDHWKTAPFWTKGPFCFCQNANNNSFWCLRTINETHNFLYCEFITGFLTYYDLRTDPYQLKNMVFDLEFGQLNQMKKQLEHLKGCRGAKECNIRTLSVKR